VRHRSWQEKVLKEKERKYKNAKSWPVWIFTSNRTNFSRKVAGYLFDKQIFNRAYQTEVYFENSSDRHRVESTVDDHFDAGDEGTRSGRREKKSGPDEFI
jgi:hypothetical protein